MLQENVGLRQLNEGLPLLNKEEIYATFWIDNNDLIKEDKQKGIKCAEVLVPDRVHSDYIFGA